MEFGERDVFDWDFFDDAAAHEELVEGAEGAEAELGSGAAELMAAEVAEIGAEIVALQRFPVRLRFTFVVVPFGEFGQRLLIVALGVNGGGAFGGKVFEKLANIFVFRFRAQL